MAIPVLTNQHGLIGAEDLRRVTIELGGVMKRLQTGFRVNSAGEDTGALVQSNILSRALDTFADSVRAGGESRIHIDKDGGHGQEDI